MMLFAANYLVILGMVHVAFGLVRFRQPIGEALREGFFGRFGQNDARRVAFWFVSAGPLISLIGGFLRHAAMVDDYTLSLPTGIVLTALATLGVSAFPKSPLWALLPPAIMLLIS